MKKLMLILTALWLAIGFSGCSSLKVYYDYDKSVDFSQYDTFGFYGWTKDSDKIISSLDRERIEDAVAYELKRRGLEYVESGGDLVVSLFITIDDKTGVTYDTDYYGGFYYGGYYRYGPGWGWGPGYTTTRAYEYEYHVGTLVVDVFDKDSEKLIWEGIAQKTVDENPQSRERNINKAVAQVMWNFPLKPKSVK